LDKIRQLSSNSVSTKFSIDIGSNYILLDNFLISELPQFCGGLRRRRYRTVRLGAPAKFIILHSKIGRRVDFARVRYGTMQSEYMRHFRSVFIAVLLRKNIEYYSK
jgi:hypothetical protein